MKNRWTIALTLILMFAGVGSAFTILVRPHEIELQPGETAQFEAQAYNTDRQAVEAEFEWSVEPSDLGRITPDGFFIAARQEGMGRVIVKTTLDSERIVGSASVKIGKGPDSEISIQVAPSKARLLPGQSIDFQAIAKGRNGISLRTHSVRWFVEPENLGTITARGTFTAGTGARIGEVIAVVEIDNRLYRGSAQVAVGPAPSASLSGYVRDTNGEALTGAMITASAIGPLPFALRTTSTEDGSFLLKGLMPGTYIIHAYSPGKIPQYYDQVFLLRQATPVILTEGEHREGIDFVLKEGGAIEGRVTDEQGNPLADAHVAAFMPSHPRLPAHAVTAQDGSYRLSGLPDGRYIFSADKPGYLIEYYSEAGNPSEAEFVEIVDAGTLDNIDFTLAQASAIVGRVTRTSDSQPIAGARVAALPLLSAQGPFDPNRPFPHQTRTDKDGNYALPVRPGIYIVRADAPGFETLWFENVRDPFQATPLQPAAGEHVQADFALGALGALSGIVRDASTQEPIPRARVSAFAENRQKSVFHTHTAEDGSYRFDALPPATYRLHVRAGGYLEQFYDHAATAAEATPIEMVNGLERDGIDFSLHTGSSIGGSVTNAETNAPISRATVIVQQIEGPINRTAQSDESGNWVVEGLPAGEYIAFAHYRGMERQFYNSAASRADAEPIALDGENDIDGVDFALLSPSAAGASISGVVLDEESGSPIEGALLLAMPATFGRPQRTLSAADGSYEINGLRPGIYYVICRAKGYIGEYYDDAHHWFDGEPIPVQEQQAVSGIDFSLIPQPRGAYWISGNVNNDSGTPIEGVLIVASEGDQVIAATVSDEDGSFLFDEMPVGNYILTASLPNTQETSNGTETGIQVGDGVSVFDAEITLIQSTTGMDNEVILPAVFSLEQNHPNPFNPTTEIAFALPENARVSLTIYNILGQPVKNLYSGSLEAGSHSLSWDGRNERDLAVPSGVYFYRFQAASAAGVFQQTRRMILMK
ncbi:carboxypeptidase regulatory-like domain-containing protein [candidate division KSB1 bacterium]|nr:carboxypeptidase regulatory-like domain-containing protein [candidate division KSB1 bacterium]